MTDIDRTAKLQMLRQQMEALGLTAADLAGAGGATLPTVRKAVERMEAIAPKRYTPKSIKTYRTGWNLLVELHGDDRLDALDFEDIEAVVDTARDRALQRRAESNGKRAERGMRPLDSTCHGAAANALSAIKALYAREYKKAKLPVAQSPAHQVELGKRPPGRRRPLTREELVKVFRVAGAGGDDPVLDALLLRSAYELGARQEGLVNLRLTDLDDHRQTAELDEKYGKRREQPLTRQLFDELVRFAHERGSVSPEDPVFRYRNGTPLTSRRFDTLFTRIRKGLPWADRAGLGLHFIRHTIGRRIERVAGKAVARRFLGHAPASVTDAYTGTLDGEVAWAWSRVMGEPHPVAETFEAGW